MPDAKISELLEKTTPLVDDDLLVIVDSEAAPNTTKKVKKKTILNAVTVSVIKASAGTINIGQVVYLVGYDSGNDVTSVELASNTSSTTMPAYGIAVSSITDSAIGKIAVIGRVSDLDTSSFSVGDALYVGTAGALTATKPTGTALVQKFGTVVRSDLSVGVIEVSGASRTNDLPNLSENNVWVGDSNGVPQEQPFSSVVAFLQYSNSVAQTTASATFSNVDLATDRESYPNSKFTKVSASDFRADFTGRVKVTYSASYYASANTRTLELGIQRAGTDVVWTQRLAFSNDNIDEPDTISGSFIMDCTNGDVFRLRKRNPTASATMTMNADDVSLLIELYSEG